jgi:DNA adenine methylase
MYPVLRYPGAKWKIVDRLIPLIPEHKVYFEPFLGSGAVFFNKHPTKLETINDYDKKVYNFFDVLRRYPSEFKRLIEHTPYSRLEYENAYIEDDDTDIEKARKFFIIAWQGYGAKQQHKTGWRRSISATSPYRAAYMRRALEDLPHIMNRLLNAQLECKDGIELIEEFNKEEAFIYIDPPYPEETRKKFLYDHDSINHERLIRICKESKAKIMISSYENELYESHLKEWSKKEIRTNSTYGSRTEVVYMNYGNKQIKFDEVRV